MTSITSSNSTKVAVDPKLNQWEFCLDTVESFGDTVSLESFRSAMARANILCLDGFLYQLEKKGIAIVSNNRLIKTNKTGKKVLFAIKKECGIGWTPDHRGCGSHREVLVDAQGNFHFQNYELHSLVTKAVNSQLNDLMSGLVQSFEYTHISGQEFKISLY